MKRKILVSVLLVSLGVAPQVLAANPVTTDLRSGTIKAGKVVNATVSKVYGDIQNPEIITHMPISGAIDFIATCADSSSSPGRATGGVVQGLLLGAKVGSVIDVEQNSATLNDEQKSITLRGSGVTCLRLAVKDLKINGAALVGGVKDKKNIVQAHIQVDLNDVEITDATLANVEISAEMLRPKLASTITPDDGNSFQGDYLELQANTPGFVSKRTNSVITAPPHACFRVNRDTGKDDPKDAKLYGTFIAPQDIVFFKRMFIDGMIGDCSDVGKDFSDNGLEAAAVLIKSQYQSMVHEEYVISKSALISDYDYVRYGFTYGVLATPFKYYPSTGVLESRSTIGGYLGYRLHDRPGVSNILAVAVGPTSASVSNTTNGVTTTNTANGATLAFAWLGQFKGEFTTGVIAGWDFFSKADNVSNNKALWLGLTLGYKIE